MKQKKNNKKQQHRVKNIYEKVPMLKTLNPEQQQAIHQIHNFLENPDNFGSFSILGKTVYLATYSSMVGYGAD